MTSATRTIVLVGLMGTGKSTIAKLVAAKLAVPCLDTDRLVEARAGETVREIFERHGEDRFRVLESEVLSECLAHDGGLVVAAAGGAVVRENNRLMLREASMNGRATVVWLHAPVEVLVARTRKGTHRPLLDSDPSGTLSRLAEERAPLYGSVADVVIDVSDRDADAVADLLLSAIDDDSQGSRGQDGGHHD